MVDGQGIAHPRRLGIAAHLGVVTGLPSIGVAKSRLFGRFEPPPATRGSWTPLTARGETIGAVVRSRDGVQPLFVSVGHRIGLEQAIELTLKTVTRYRLPEPTRLADKLSRAHPG
jgi:deoxyribonuclease V